MARLTKEEKKVFDPTLLIQNQNWKANQLLNESKNNEIAGRSEDAKSFLDTWRINNLGTKDSGVLPPVDAVPPHLRGIIFKRASTDGLKIAQADPEVTDEQGVAPGPGGEWLDPKIKMKIMQMREEELKKQQNKKNRKK